MEKGGHQEFLPQSSAKVSVISLQSVLLYWPTIPRTVNKQPWVLRRSRAFHDVSRIGFCKTLSVHYPSVCL